ncbi:MAG: hypothetical protein ACE5JT_00575 [Nitrosopumilaceae archaeon]
MAHNEHNKPRRSGGFFLIIFGALLFILVPTYLKDSPELGIAAIVFGFIVGGLGFYLNFIRGRKKIG